MADSLEVVEGVKVTLTVQEVIAANLEPGAGHILLAMAKSEELVLVRMVTPGVLMVIAALVLLTRATVSAELFVLVT